jgi:hypothetical protein
VLNNYTWTDGAHQFYEPTNEPTNEPTAELGKTQTPSLATVENSIHAAGGSASISRSLARPNMGNLQSYLESASVSSLSESRAPIRQADSNDSNTLTPKYSHEVVTFC